MVAGKRPSNFGALRRRRRRFACDADTCGALIAPLDRKLRLVRVDRRARDVLDLVEQLFRIGIPLTNGFHPEERFCPFARRSYGQEKGACCQCLEYAHIDVIANAPVKMTRDRVDVGHFLEELPTTNVF